MGYAIYFGSQALIIIQQGNNPANPVANNQNQKLEIYTTLGKRLMSDDIVGEQKHQINLGNAPNGIYLVRIMAGGQVKTIKLVKQ